MSRSLWKTLLALAALIALLGLGACGGDDDEGEGGGTPAQSQSGGGDANVTEQLFAGSAVTNIAKPEEGKKGGKLTMLSAGDVDYMDPGKTYYSYGFAIMNAIHRGLYAYPPRQGQIEAVPDLAEDMPDISEDGKTVTVKLKSGVKFSPPVNREVTSKDVKYAIERAFTAAVANGYARAYMSDLIGAPKEPGDYKEIPGIETPDDQTIIFKLKQGTGPALAGALAMPISAPVPKEY